MDELVTPWSFIAFLKDIEAEVNEELKELELTQEVEDDVPPWELKF